MSLQAMAWAIEQRRVTDPTARHVLLCLANYAGKTGQDAWCSASTLSEETGLSLRTIRYKLDQLLEAGVIRLGDQAVVALKVARPDRRPVVYDLDMPRGAAHAPREVDTRDGSAATERRAPAAPRSDDAESMRGAGDAPRCTGGERDAPAAPRDERGADPAPREPERGANDATNGVHVLHPIQEQKKPIEQKQKLSAQPAVGRFAEWWAVYPKKVARKKAEEIWRRRRLDAIADRLIADVENRTANDDRWRRGFSPDPTTYLNQDRWEDELVTAPVGQVPEASGVGRSGTSAAPMSKSEEGLFGLEMMIHDAQQRMVAGGDCPGHSEARPALVGPDAGV